MGTLMNTEITCLIVPITNGSLIFPQNMLAEVHAVDDVEPSDNPLLSGWVDWSRRRVPVVSFEHLCDAHLTKRLIQKVVVMHTVLGQQDLPFIGIATEGIPHSVTINASILQEQDLDIVSPYVIAHLLVSNLPCILPDWPRIEEMVSI